MRSVVVIDNQESRGALVKEILDANGYETFVLSSLDDVQNIDWQRFPDAILLTEGVAECAMEPGSLGTLICTDSDAIDPLRLDALLLVAISPDLASIFEHDKPDPRSIPRPLAFSA